VENFMRHIQFKAEDTIIDIRRDSVFKAAFTTDSSSSQGALQALISAFIGRNLEVLTIIANEPPSPDLRDRQIRYDIRVKLDRGELANVEMTLHPGRFEPLRFEYYTARLHAAQELKGGQKDYRDLVPAWQINFVSARRIFPDGPFFHQFEYYDRKRDISLGGRTRILVVELEKVESLLSKPVEELNAVERWAVFFRYAAAPEWRGVINKLMSKEEGIAMAGEMLLTVTREEIEQAQQDTALKIELDWNSYMAEAREEGETEGLAKGLAKGQVKGETIGWQKRDEKARQEKLEAAWKMKEDGFSPEQIQKYTALSPEDIEALQLRN
jgi:predicted transposase/invertase (TIGR01784 family)